MFEWTGSCQKEDWAFENVSEMTLDSKIWQQNIQGRCWIYSVTQYTTKRGQLQAGWIGINRNKRAKLSNPRLSDRNLSRHKDKANIAANVRCLEKRIS
jgi:hypothetical protein